MTSFKSKLSTCWLKSTFWRKNAHPQKPDSEEEKLAEEWVESVWLCLTSLWGELKFYEAKRVVWNYVECHCVYISARGGTEVHFAAGIDSKSLHWENNTENSSAFCQNVWWCLGGGNLDFQMCDFINLSDPWCMQYALPNVSSKPAKGSIQKPL